MKMLIMKVISYLHMIVMSRMRMRVLMRVAIRGPCWVKGRGRKKRMRARVDIKAKERDMLE
jgi:hypothetical protein